MKEGKTLTFVELLDRVDQIQIPILQRDYAQGRAEATEIRNRFLHSLKTVLTDSNINSFLDLDFVYGNFENDANKEFSVLDGQQRLTTLFLLYWYIALKEKRVLEFREKFSDNGRSKFTYKTRVSAAEFFNALVMVDVNLFDDLSVSVSETIIDKNWFFASWKSDPTVNSCLQMLDSMHEVFGTLPQKFYDQLVDTNFPKIVFQYLNLESFGLSDELYIKMNARGKALTDFENFKAWLFSQLVENPNSSRIENKLDQKWTDVFWKLSQTSIYTFDELYLRFFNLLAFYRMVEKVEVSFDALPIEEKNWLRNLRTAYDYVSVDDLANFDSFDKNNLFRLENVLDHFSEYLNNESTLKILKDALETSDYVGQIKFYAYICFINRNKVSGIYSHESSEQLLQWLRITGNLINNHRIDELVTFVPALRRLYQLSVHCNEIYQFIAKSGLESGFTKSQREEEELKAKLILEDITLESLFIKYEKHAYLQGKIGFLLKLSQSDDEGHIDIAQFEMFADKVAKLLSEDFLSSEDFLLQRALLALGDYLIPQQSNRFSFGLPNRSTYRERSENWLNVLSYPVFEELLNLIDIDVEESLNKIINKVNCGGWRQLIVENPQAISYCKKRLVHKKNGNIDLLTKSTFRGFNTELRTFLLYTKLLEKEINSGGIKDIKNILLNEEYGYEYSHVLIELEGIVTRIAYDNEAFFAFNGKDENGKLQQIDIPQILVDIIKEIFPDEKIK